MTRDANLKQTLKGRGPDVFEPQRISRLDQLHYMVEMVDEMRKMAAVLEQPALAYLLELATMEAQMQLQIENEANP